MSMDTEVWQVLGLAPTGDARAIKRAYAALLKQTSPEDDPEGFQRLREAYDEALKQAKAIAADATGEADGAAGQEAQDGRPERGARLPAWGEANRLALRRKSREAPEESERTEKRDPSEPATRRQEQPGASGTASSPEAPGAGRSGEVETFMRRLHSIYNDYASRIRIEAWSELLESGQLQDLAFKQEIQPELLRFLAAHYQLPLPVWRMLDRLFYWTEDEIGLTRLVPPEFAAFVIDSIRQPSELRFEFLPAAPDFDPDEFLGLRSRGASLLRSGRLREAVEDFDRACEMFGFDPDLLRLRATALHLLGEDLRAEEDWRAILHSYPGERDALLRLADRLLDTERASEALGLIRRALDLLPNDPAALLALARCLRELECFAEARQSCELALLLEPSDIELRIRLLELRELELEGLLRVLKRYPGDREARFAAGELLLELERYEECEALMTEAPLYGLTSGMKALLGRALLELDRAEEAAPLFDQAVETADSERPDGCYAKLRRGLFRLRLRDLQGAEADLLAAASLGAGGHELAAGLAVCAHSARRCEEALAYIDEALYGKPDSRYHHFRAHILYDLKRYEEAIAPLDLRLDFEQEPMPVFWMKGVCHMKIGQYEEAMEYLSRARSLDDSVTVRYRLAELYIRLERYEEAAAELQDVPNKDDALLLLLGYACRKLGRRGDALRCFVDAANLAPRDLRAARFALDELAAGGDIAALTYAERILEASPDDIETQMRRLSILFEYGRTAEARQALAEMLDRVSPGGVHPYIRHYAGTLLLDRREYAQAAEQLQYAYDAGLRDDTASLLSIARFETGMADEALRLAREVLAAEPEHADYRARLERMEGKSKTSGILRLLQGRPNRESWPFSVKLRPLLFAPRDEPPYDTEVVWT
ncbi:tetratricopeptide repeat protein [Saccharibacillus sp. CPCC 101409]|uniref:tetratricopeptide repeat protein n=1 Tax=Saccharibacillus sp. CPCC 101409 TaxID=3058041 RepID=UPI002671F731|nr:tetratricopeptide repeat protein [Saccharibacillus sp. CPCC 101409]MDO3411987.1 tetratricopeptide repeat protein [Saccharibacillus sp. CPCC 101409]